MVRLLYLLIGKMASQTTSWVSRKWKKICNSLSHQMWEFLKEVCWKILLICSIIIPAINRCRAIWWILCVYHWNPEAPTCLNMHPFLLHRSGNVCLCVPSSWRLLEWWQLRVRHWVGLQETIWQHSRPTCHDASSSRALSLGVASCRSAQGNLFENLYPLKNLRKNIFHLNVILNMIELFL